MQEIKDLRVQKTQQAIARAFFEELAEKPFTSISVAELAQRANIGKATFYNHYLDKYDLATQLIADNFFPLDDMLIQRAQSGDWTRIAKPLPPHFDQTLQHLRLLSRIHTDEVDFDDIVTQRLTNSFKRQLDQRSVLLTHSTEITTYLAKLGFCFFMNTINAADPLDPKASHQQFEEFIIALRALSQPHGSTPASTGN
ncbi:TetR/AcrR family transcriptional regulator [Lacticaseibacillus sp. N501-2]|uniref:TetR/AcrR family transcriptional regulator n=1 Tax=Lacticaseibacillus salsurae TaxID=3367729 RepID=UPI0038B3B77C